VSYTKRQFVTKAFEEIGLAEYVFDLGPEQLQSAMHRLDAMMAGWNNRGLRLGYPVPSSPENSDLDEETAVPDRANLAVILNLAILIAPGYGKTVSPDTKANAKTFLNGLFGKAAHPNEMKLPDTMPRGQGQKPWRDTGEEYLDTPEDPLTAGTDSELEFY